MARSREGPGAFLTMSLRVFGPMAARRMPNHPDLPIKLARARNPLVPSAYLASVYARMALGGLLGILLLGLYVAIAGGVAHADPFLVAALAASPVVFAAFAYSFDLVRPDLEIASRRRDLDANLPYALNFMASLAAAGVVPTEVFGALGKQRVYGEVSEQAKNIYRDTKLFSKDLVTALQDASRRSPSRTFEEFLQGALNTVTSGGDLRTYLMAKAEQFGMENRRKQKAFLESLGVMAESYVVVAAAAPLFLLVILSIMAILREGGDPVFFLNLLVLLALPLIHASFTWILRSLRPE